LYDVELEFCGKALDAPYMNDAAGVSSLIVVVVDDKTENARMSTTSKRIAKN
jgi:hypothetical protein